MRNGILKLNSEFRDVMSNDLGAMGGFLFDIGSGRYSGPPREVDPTLRAAWEADLARVRVEADAARSAAAKAGEGDRTHSEIQFWLLTLGRSLGFDTSVAANDRSRLFDGVPLGDGCLSELPRAIAEALGADMIRLIDVLWLDRASHSVAAAFEVEHEVNLLWHHSTVGPRAGCSFDRDPRTIPGCTGRPRGTSTSPIGQARFPASL